MHGERDQGVIPGPLVGSATEPPLAVAAPVLTGPLELVPPHHGQRRLVQIVLRGSAQLERAGFILSLPIAAEAWWAAPTHDPLLPMFA